MWVVLAAVLVLFMQAGFMFLEVGFVRAKNAGTIVAKILTNMSIAAICYWAVGFAFAFGSGDVFGTNSTLASIIGSNGFFLQVAGTGTADAVGNSGLPVMSLSAASIDAKFLFQFAFCAVSLAIVWGSTLERDKYGAYVIDDAGRAQRTKARDAESGHPWRRTREGSSLRGRSARRPALARRLWRYERHRDSHSGKRYLATTHIGLSRIDGRRPRLRPRVTHSPRCTEASALIGSVERNRDRLAKPGSTGGRNAASRILDTWIKILRPPRPRLPWSPLTLRSGGLTLPGY